MEPMTVEQLAAARLALDHAFPPAPAAWCGQCLYTTRQRWNDGRLIACPRCQPDQEGPQQ